MPTIPAVDVNDLPDLVDVMPDLCRRHRQLTDQIAKRETERKELKGLIDGLMEATGEVKVAGDGWLVLQSMNRSSKLSPERLLKKGVTMKQIEYATVVTERPYYQVRKA